MKQARALGVGVVIATQNPMDLDYRALSNSGLWWIGPLQTDADRARVMNGLSGATNNSDDHAERARIVPRLAPRWFVAKNAHASAVGPILLMPRDTGSLMRGPLTRNELRPVRTWQAGAAQVADAVNVQQVEAVQ